MNEDNRPLPEPPRMLTMSGKRALPATMIRASDRAIPAALVADMLDATAAAVLRIAGWTPRPDAPLHFLVEREVER